MMDNRKRRDGVGALFLRIGEGRRRQNSGIFLCFCLLRGARGPGLEATVDKIQAFRSLFVYFGDRARPFWRQQ